jgi:FMNH2-dependent dimethyl sulfone monooxygenase
LLSFDGAGVNIRADEDAKEHGRREQMSAQRQSRNPIFNGNKFKIGMFATNTIGTVQTTAPNAFQPGWENSLRVAKLADRAGFEAILGLARWKNPGTPAMDHRGHVVLDSFTWTAALAMATRYSGLFATSHAPTAHPLVVAKQCATIDHISGGRFGLNVVGGWNRSEFDMFGIELLAHDQRYDYLEEWLTVIFKLWEEREAFDFDGKFLKLRDALSMPQPVQKPRPPILNAGLSARGRRFSCQFADCCFVTSEITRQTSKDEIMSYKKLAQEEFGREVMVWMQVPIVQGRTRADAEAMLNDVAVRQEDRASVDGWSSGISAESRTLTNEKMNFSRLNVAMGGMPVAGSAGDIADYLEALSEIGIDGMMAAWIDFDDGVTRFNEEVLPLLEKRGLRQKFSHAEISSAAL